MIAIVDIYCMRISCSDRPWNS